MMATKRNNRLVIDLGKVAYTNFFYRNQTGLVRATKPKRPSVNGTEFNPKEIAPRLEHALQETLLARAKRRGLLDVWTPVFLVRMCCADKLEFTGNKAKQLRDAWNAKQYGTK